MSDFKNYNNCLISKLPPHKTPNIKRISEEIKENHCMLARWTSNFDCKYETEWWYLIKDDKWDIAKLKSHDRNEINKGKKNFICRIINPDKYSEELYNVYLSASLEYSGLSRNIIKKEKFIKFNSSDIYIAAFDLEDGKLSAYSKCELYYGDVKTINLSMLKINPAKKRRSPSAALMDYICDYFLNKNHFKYICDGERSIRHVTNFQKYLEKYFGFRKCYCDLNVAYSSKLKIAINILYPFRSIIKALSKYSKKIYNAYCILHQEEIARSFIMRSGEKNDI